MEDYSSPNHGERRACVGQPQRAYMRGIQAILLSSMTTYVVTKGAPKVEFRWLRQINCGW